MNITLNEIREDYDNFDDFVHDNARFKVGDDIVVWDENKQIHGTITEIIYYTEIGGGFRYKTSMYAWGKCNDFYEDELERP